MEEQAKDNDQNRKRLVLLLVVLIVLIVGFLGWAYYNNKSAQLGKDYSSSYEIQSRDHINPGDPHPPYNSNPPTSGWHYPNPAFEEFYDHTLPDEQLVHNLEHGDIWVSYRTSVPAEVISELKALAGDFVIVTRRDANDHDISIAAWGKLDTFNLQNGKLDKKRINDFIERYKNQGPEKVTHNL